MNLNSSKLRFIGIAWIFASVVVAWPTIAQTNDYSGPVWALVDASKARAAAADITPANYPNCDDATVEKKMMRVYRSDGTGECQDDAYTKVLTEKGRRGNRMISLSFMLPYSTVSVPTLELIKADGRVVPIDVAANSKETIDDSQMSANIYDPNEKILQVNIPGVEVGDLIHAVTRQTIERSFVPGEYSEENRPGGAELYFARVLRSPCAGGSAACAHCDAGRSAWDGDLFKTDGAGWRNDSPLGNSQCAAHV